MKVATLILITLLISEVLLRFLIPEPRMAMSLVYDSELGHRGPKNTFIDVGNTFYGLDGFRTHLSHPYRSHPREPRIVIYGDSFTESSATPDREIYTHVLERSLLMERFPVEVIGLGASDFGTLQELLTYTRTTNYSGDIVALQFFGLNDFINNEISYAGKNQGRGDLLRPYAIPEGDTSYPVYGNVQGINYTYRAPSLKWLRDHIHLFRVIEANIRHLLSGITAPLPPCTSELQLFLRDPTESFAQAIRTTTRLLRAFKIQVEAGSEHENSRRFSKKSPKFVIMYFPSQLEVDRVIWNGGNASIKNRVMSCHPGRVAEQHAGEAAVKQIAENLGIPFFSLRPALERAVNEKRKVFLVDGHLNSEGQAVVGEALTPFFKRLLPRLDSESGSGH